MIGIDPLAADRTILVRMVPKISHPGKCREIESPGTIAAFGTLGTEPRQFHNHEFRVNLSKLIIPQAKFVQHPGRKILQYCIRLARQLSDELRASGMFEIDAQGTDAEVALDEPRRRIDIFVLPIVAEGIEPAFAGFD